MQFMAHKHQPTFALVVKTNNNGGKKLIIFSPNKDKTPKVMNIEKAFMDQWVVAKGSDDFDPNTKNVLKRYADQKGYKLENTSNDKHPLQENYERLFKTSL